MQQREYEGLLSVAYCMLLPSTSADFEQVNNGKLSCKPSIFISLDESFCDL